MAKEMSWSRVILVWKNSTSSNGERIFVSFMTNVSRQGCQNYFPYVQWHIWKKFMLTNLKIFLNVGHGAEILRHRQTLFDAVSKLIFQVKRDDLMIYFLLRTIFFSIIFVHWMEKFHFLAKNPSNYSVLHSTCPEEEFKQLFLEKRFFSSFFDNQRKFLWRKLFRRILKIAHLTAKRNPWFRINFASEFYHFRTLSKILSSFFGQTFLASIPLLNFTF